ncbi:hypothetical protein Tco_1504549 [Tanacetum coccineum]
MAPREPQSPPSIDFVPELMYPEYMPQEDEILPAEEQPLPADALPTADSPGYVLESDPEEELEENDKDPEEDPADYPTDRMMMMMMRADYGFVSTMDTEIRRQRAEEVGYGIKDVWVDPREAIDKVAPMTLEGVNTRVTELTAVQEQDTQDIYAMIEDTQDRQTQIYHSVGTLVDDKILALRSVVMGQQAVISQLQAADRKSQVVDLEMLLADLPKAGEDGSSS